MIQCRCSIRDRLVGDGCHLCNALEQARGLLLQASSHKDGWHDRQQALLATIKDLLCPEPERAS